MVEARSLPRGLEGPNDFRDHGITDGIAELAN